MKHLNGFLKIQRKKRLINVKDTLHKDKKRWPEEG